MDFRTMRRHRRAAGRIVSAGLMMAVAVLLGNLNADAADRNAGRDPADSTYFEGKQMPSVQPGTGDYLYFEKEPVPGDEAGPQGEDRLQGEADWNRFYGISPQEPEYDFLPSDPRWDWARDTEVQ